jgi:hypothetical protein
MADDRPKATRLNVFISYSRADLAFADQLEAALGPCGFATTLDRHGISGGEDWQPRLAALIRHADTIVFVLSPSSAQSDVCAWEVEQATQLGKRIIPVLCCPLDGATTPPPLLSRLNYIFFYAEPKLPGSGFGVGLVQLVAALNTDLEWLREHTRLLQRASEWASATRATDRLLFGKSIADAKAWAARRPADAPEPTALHLEFIRASEAWEVQQQNAERQQLEEIAAAQSERGKALAAAESALRDRAAALQREAAASRRVVQRTVGGLVVALLLAGAAGLAYFDAKRSRQRAEREAAQARIAQKAEEAAKLDLKAKVDELTAANIRLTPSVKLRIGHPAPGSMGGHIIREDWYKIATDGTRAVVVMKAPGNPMYSSSFIGTGFAVKGSALADTLGPEPVVVTAHHAASVSRKGDSIDPFGLRAYFPGIGDKAEIGFDRVIWASANHDVVVLGVGTPLPFGAIPIHSVTRLDTAMHFVSQTDGSQDGARNRSLMVLSYLAVDPRQPLLRPQDVGFHLGVAQSLRAEVRSHPLPNADDPRASTLWYTHVTAGGASGAPVFDANTGEVLCVHHSGRPPEGGCGWLGGVRRSIVEDKK